jgi:hypothetical protein
MASTKASGTAQAASQQAAARTRSPGTRAASAPNKTAVTQPGNNAGTLVRAPEGETSGDGWAPGTDGTARRTMSARWGQPASRPTAAREPVSASGNG